MADSDPMIKLYKRLSAAGFPKSYLRNCVLPKSWDDAYSHDPVQYGKLLAFLSRHLSITESSLAGGTAPLVFDDSRARFFKGPEVEDDSDAGLHVLEGLARVVRIGMSVPSPNSIAPAATVRRAILADGNAWVSFQSLITYCWNIGVPVIYVANLPPKAKKLPAAVVEVDGQPAIFLCQRHRYPARHLSRLAHEVGHFAGNHLRFIGLMASIATELVFNERTESEAYRYAADLLTGGQVIPPDPRRYRNVSDLVDATYDRSQQYRVDPGYLIVNRAGVTGDWKEASIALAIIEGNASAADLIGAELRKRVDWKSVPVASRSFFERIIGSQLRLRAIPSVQPPMQVKSPRAHTISPTRKLFERWAAEDAALTLEEQLQQQRDWDEIEERLRRSRLDLEGRTDLRVVLSEGTVA